MIIKLNGVPWDTVKTPEPHFVPLHPITNTVEAIANALGGHAEAADQHLDAAYKTFDQTNYWIMHQTQATEHVYRFSCWAMEHSVKIVGAVIGVDM